MIVRVPDSRPVARPITRAGCEGEGACPWVSCRHHIGVDVTKEGAFWTPGMRSFRNFQHVTDRELKKRFVAWLEEWEPGDPTCVLDVADEGGKTLDEVGKILKITRERVRQIENQALSNIAKRHGDLVDFMEGLGNGND